MNKILAIFSNHTYDIIKYNVTINNLTYILPHVTNAIIIDSIDEEYANKLKNDIYENKNLKELDKIKEYYLVKNNKIYVDFGKWIHVLENSCLIKNYDYILFINDSIIITHDMTEYFNYLYECNNKNKENKKNNINIYGYNDSSQFQYHYQSYLFMINTKIIDKFINFYKLKKPLIYDINSLIHNMELNICNIDPLHDAYIKIAKTENIKKNIFWENDKIYEKLLTNNKLCLIKLRRIQDYEKNIIMIIILKFLIILIIITIKNNMKILNILITKILKHIF